MLLSMVFSRIRLMHSKGFSSKYWMNINFLSCSVLSKHIKKYKFNRALIYPFRVIRSWVDIEISSKMQTKCESLWMTTFLIFKHHLQCYPYIGCKFCMKCECLGNKNSSFIKEQVSRNFRNGRSCKNHGLISQQVWKV